MDHKPYTPPAPRLDVDVDALAALLRRRHAELDRLTAGQPVQSSTPAGPTAATAEAA